jgi:hypothetical protein
MSTPKEQLIFAISPDAKGDGAMLMLGVTRECFEEMVEGISKDIDLAEVGIPLKLMMFACDDKESGIAMLKAECAKAGVKVHDARNQDFSIKTRN